ncbi:hypothetical protein [Rhodopseudomonas sp. AAP120]|uniref:hypothetical protein n=1 Tax=Rhodopseudomonas sp. AAP120 TaxID=1523430 RepID=UPI000B1398E5|nr:hypothetical protein [Rhodopseudomonas sp. AAP120]
MSDLTDTNLATQLKWLHNAPDFSREAHFEKLTEKYGDGFANAVRREFERQQEQQELKR